MRILLSHVFSWPEVRRGGERYLHELAGALRESGHDVQILSTAPTPGRGTVLGVPVRYLRRRSFHRRRFGRLASEVAFGGQATLRAVVGNFDVWHGLGTSDAAAAAALGRVHPGLRSVYTDLGIPSAIRRRARPDWPMHRFVVRHVDEYIALSHAAARELAEGFGRQPAVVGGGVDLRRFTPGRRSDQPSILFSGTLDAPQKQAGLLLDAFTLILDQEPRARLVLSGPGDATDLLAGRPGRVLDRVTVPALGDPDEIVCRYQDAWVTVLPSVEEAFGLVLVESLACGTPVVALADGGGPADIVEGGTGVLSGADAESLAESVLIGLDMTSDDSRAERCRARAQAFDWKTSIVPRLEQIYRGEAGTSPEAMTEPARPPCIE